MFLLIFLYLEYSAILAAMQCRSIPISGAVLIILLLAIVVFLTYGIFKVETIYIFNDEIRVRTMLSKASFNLNEFQEWFLSSVDEDKVYPKMLLIKGSNSGVYKITIEEGEAEVFTKMLDALKLQITENPNLKKKFNFKQKRIAQLVLYSFSFAIMVSGIYFLYHGIHDNTCVADTEAIKGSLTGIPEERGNGRAKWDFYFKLFNYPGVIFKAECLSNFGLRTDLKRGDSLFLRMQKNSLKSLNHNNELAFWDNLFHHNPNEVTVCSVESVGNTYLTVDDYNGNLIWNRILPGVSLMLISFGLAFLFYRVYIKQSEEGR